MENKIIQTTKTTISKKDRNTREYAAKKKALKMDNIKHQGAAQPEKNKDTPPAKLTTPVMEQEVVLWDLVKNQIIHPRTVDLSGGDLSLLPKRAKVAVAKDTYTLEFPGDVFFQSSKENCLMLFNKTITNIDKPKLSIQKSTDVTEKAVI